MKFDDIEIKIRKHHSPPHPKNEYEIAITNHYEKTGDSYYFSKEEMEEIRDAINAALA